MDGLIVVGIIGVAGSGKTLVARHLIERYGFVRRRFAGPLKRMLRAGLGLTDAQLDGDEKAVPLPQFGGATPRALMQTLGTEWGRRTIDPGLWVTCWQRDVREAGGLVVCDDVRFPNEAAAVRSFGGTLWRVYRPGLVSMDHASERSQRDIAEDVLLNNATTIPDLIRSVDVLVGGLRETMGEALALHCAR